jgi:hypothetical protein
MKNEINEFSIPDFKIRNFKSNVKLRLPNAVNKID